MSIKALHVMLKNDLIHQIMQLKDHYQEVKTEKWFD